MRSKLFWVSLLLFVIAGTVSGSYLEGALRQRLTESLQDELARHVRAARVAVELAPGSLAIAAMDPLADRLGGATSTRVSIIAPDGRVLGDSGLDRAQVARAENHNQRPEIAEALRQGQGSSRRFSTTLDADMMYVAATYQRGTQRGVVRVSMSLSKVEEIVGGLRVILVIAGVLGLVIAVFGSGLASHLMSRALVELAERARSVASGSERRIDVSSGDEIGHLAGTVNRIALELEQAVSTLAHERSRLEAVLEGMSDPVVALDYDLRITLMNPAAMGLLGLSSHARGQLLVEAIRLPALHELATKGRTGATSGEITLPARGEPRLLVRATPLRARAGVVVVLHDVTELRRLETVRRDFVANVSHELRTPISIIRANAETLLEGALEEPEMARRFLQATVRNSERLSQIVADLLDLATIEAGTYGLQPEPQSLYAAARRVAEGLRATAATRNAEIALDVSKELWVAADSKALEQVLLNLLDNAVKYTQSGGHVRICAAQHNGQVRVEVVDDGPGIAPRYRERIFERFYRVDPGRSRELGGTGLGLSIVRHLIENMEGQVGMRPAGGGGSVFWFTLPRSEVGGPKDDSTPEPEPPVSDALSQP